MKTLNTYITEWKANTNTVSYIEKKNIQYFVYKLTANKRIKIFDRDWPQLKDYKGKVYIDGKHIEIGNDGYIIEDDYIKSSNYPKEYKVYIEDIDDIRNCRFMFYDCEDLISVPFFDTMMVEDMYSMFKYCENLKTIPKFNTKNVKSMYEMFWECDKLESVPLFDTSKVENMSGMFYNCLNLLNVPLFDTSNVKDMNSMFVYCKNLSDETKKEWSKVYNFERNDKKK